MEFQTSSSRRKFLSAAARTAGAAIMLRPRLSWAAADMLDLRVAGIVASTIGIDTHNHIDVPLTAGEMIGADIDLAGEMKKSGAPRMNDSLRNAFVIEVVDLFSKDKVFKNHWSWTGRVR